MGAAVNVKGAAIRNAASATLVTASAFPHDARA
jgi:hypothetical protein